MDGIADMGGTSGWGMAHPPDGNEPVFAEPWHARAFALALLSNRLAGGNLDTFRHAIERLDRSAYLDDGYFGRWLNAADLLLTENAILKPSAVDARARKLRGDVVDEPEAANAEPQTASAAADSLRSIDAAPAFAVGDHVRAKDMSPPGHTRLPRYARGHVGVVAVVQPAFVFPDTNAHHRGENPQYVYSVRFDSHELWGDEAETFAVTVDMYEDYLEKKS